MLTVGLNFKILYAMVAMIWRFCLNMSDTVTIIVKNVDYRCIIYDIKKSETINLLKNFVTIYKNAYPRNKY